MLLTLGLDSLFGALESVTTALQDVRGFGKLRREVLSGEHRVRSEPSFRRSLVENLTIPYAIPSKIGAKGANPVNVLWELPSS